MLTVKALERGYYGDLREEGATFPISDLGGFSKRWMEPVSWDYAEEKAKADKAAEDAKKPAEVKK